MERIGNSIGNFCAKTPLASPRAVTLRSIVNHVNPAMWRSGWVRSYVAQLWIRGQHMGPSTASESVWIDGESWDLELKIEVAQRRRMWGHAVEANDVSASTGSSE